MESLSHPSLAGSLAGSLVGSPARPSRPVLTHLFAFRALAIIVIVAGHCIDVFDWSGSPGPQWFLMGVLENGTVLFVFIAGYLFEYLSGRFEYRRYLSGKLRDVILPYLLVSVPGLVHDMSTYEGSWQGWLYKVIWLLLQGGAGLNFPLWFIPMIALYYLAAPAFILFVRHPRLYALLPLLVVLSALIHRVEDNSATTFQAAYFLSAYVAGMWASHVRQSLEPVLKKYWLPLAVALGAYLLFASDAGGQALAVQGRQVAAQRLQERDDGDTSSNQWHIRLRLLFAMGSPCTTSAPTQPPRSFDLSNRASLAWRSTATGPAR